VYLGCFYVKIIDNNKKMFNPFRPKYKSDSTRFFLYTTLLLFIFTWSVLSAQTVDLPLVEAVIPIENNDININSGVSLIDAGIVDSATVNSIVTEPETVSVENIDLATAPITPEVVDITSTATSSIATDNTTQATSTDFFENIIDTVTGISDQITDSVTNVIDNITDVITGTSTPEIIIEATSTTATIEVSELITDTGKLITVSSPDENPEAPLVDVLASTTIPKIYKVGEESRIQIKWKNNDNQAMQFSSFDTNGDGYLDYIEWTIPHLSTQIFEIIFISKAFQLDQDQNIIADIYDTVKTQDGNYASLTDGQYIITTFAKVLDSTKDITLYAKSTNIEQSATIEVYPVYTDEDGNKIEGSLIATFNDVADENVYKILLTNLEIPTDTFDLKIVGDVDIDYIVDPIFSCQSNATGAWSSIATWTNCNGTVPQIVDSVEIRTGHTVTIDVATAITVASLSVGTSSTLVMSNGNATTKKLNVTGDVIIYSAGNLTHTSNNVAETHRLNLSVGGNLTVNSGGNINVDGKGYQNYNGPGFQSGGASYGGRGISIGVTYGSITTPVNIGSSDNGSGGGAVILSVAGLTTISGSISTGGAQRGTGGSIYITTSMIGGGGTLQSNGGWYTNSSGGRISLVLTGENADFSSFSSAVITAYGGSSGGYGAAGTIYKQTTAQGAGGGDLIINNNNNATSLGIDTAISSLVTGTTVGGVTIVGSKAGKLTIDSGRSLTIQGTGTTMTIGSGTTLTNNGTLNLGGTTFIRTGTLTSGTSSTITYTGQSDNSPVTLLNTAYKNLTINKFGTTFNLPATTTIANNLTIATGTLDVTTSNFGLTLAGNWANPFGTSGFNPRAGTVTLNGTNQTISDSNTFYDLVKSVTSSSTLTFVASTTQTITHALTLNGIAGQLLNLVSSIPGVPWNLNTTGAVTVVNYVGAQDSNSIAKMYASNSVNNLRNTNWVYNTKRWIGTTTSWSTAGNWSPSGVPDSTSDVVIDNTAVSLPTIDVTTAVTINSLSISTSTLTMSNGNDTTKKLIVNGDVRIYGGGVLTHTANTTTAAGEVHRLNLAVGGNLIVDSGGTINVDLKGYSAYNGTGYPGAYGGKSSLGGNTYGSITIPVNLGSGGTESAGGGSALVSVAGLTTINGIVSSIGSSNSSGGSIYIISNTIGGSGVLRANGGSGYYQAGGGGRVSVILTGAGADFANFSSSTITAYGGSVTSGDNSSAGTVYMETGDQHAVPGSGTLIIDNNNISTLTRLCTLMPTAVNVNQFSQVVIKRNGNLCVNSDDTLNINTLNLSLPDANRAKAFITIFPKTVSSGAPKYYMPDNVTLGNTIANYTLVLGTPAGHFLDGIMGHEGDLTVASTGNITHVENETTEVNRINLSIIGNLTVNAGGTINADLKGYNNSGPGYSGSYGGKSAPSGGNTYGSITTPVNLGSGGGYTRGGGSISLLSTGLTTINGTITANGANDSSGGSIYITTATIAGSGTLRSNSPDGCHSSGAGGRIALILTGSNADFSNFNSSTITAYGGLLGCSGLASAAGTIYKQTTAQGPGKGDLIINNNNANTNAGIETTISSLVTDTSVGSLTLVGSKKGKLTINSGQTLTIQGTGTAMTIGAGTTLTNNGTLNLGGTTFTNSGTFTSGTGSTITYIGQSDDSPVTLLNTIYKNLILNKSGTTFNLPAITTIANNLTIATGTLDVTASNYGISLAGNWNNTGLFNARGGAVSFSSTTQQVLGSTIFNKINGPATISIIPSGTIVGENNTIIATNDGTITTNSYIGIVGINNSTITTNSGVIAINNSTLATNTNTGVVSINNSSIITNNGTTTTNGLSGIINTNNGIITNNLGSIGINNGIANTNIFNDGQYNGEAGIITGNSTFAYSDLIAVNGAVVDQTGYANGIVNGLSFDLLGNTIYTWIFNNTDNLGNVTGDALFAGTTTNIGSVYGDAIFTASSVNSGIVTGNVDIYYPTPRPFGGIVNGTKTYHNYPAFYFNDKDTNDGNWNNPLNWWTSDSFSTSSGDIPGRGDIVHVYSDIATTTTPAYASAVTFERESENHISINVTDNVTFFSTSTNSIDGNIIASSTTFIGNVTDNLGTVTGTLIRKFTESVTTTRNFLTEGRRNDWVIIAEGVVVSLWDGVIGATYDLTTNIFKAFNGGLFTENPNVNGGAHVVPKIIITTPTAGENIKWMPSVDWDTSTICEYSYNNFASTTTVDCSKDGSDIARPVSRDTEGDLISYTLYLRGKVGENLTETTGITFTYDNTVPIYTSCGTDLLDEATRPYYYLSNDITNDCHITVDTEIRGGNFTIHGDVIANATSSGTNGFNIDISNINITGTTSSIGGDNNNGNGGNGGNITIATSTTSSVTTKGGNANLDGGNGGNISITNSRSNNSSDVIITNGGNSLSCGNGGNGGLVNIINSSYGLVTNAGGLSNQTGCSDSNNRQPGSSGQTTTIGAGYIPPHNANDDISAADALSRNSTNKTQPAGSSNVLFNMLNNIIDPFIYRDIKKFNPFSSDFKTTNLGNTVIPAIFTNFKTVPYLYFEQLTSILLTNMYRFVDNSKSKTLNTKSLLEDYLYSNGININKQQDLVKLSLNPIKLTSEIIKNTNELFVVKFNNISLSTYLTYNDKSKSLAQLVKITGGQNIIIINQTNNKSLNYKASNKAGRYILNQDDKGIPLIIEVLETQKIETKKEGFWNWFKGWFK
jgi:hypothetical protein